MKYKRVLLKLSGEALMGNRQYGIDNDRLVEYAKEIKKVVDGGCELALGVGPGDEVIVPANTYIATAWGVSYTGATPVFADCTPDTWEIDPSVLEAKITEKTKGCWQNTLTQKPLNWLSSVKQPQITLPLPL
jgi:hypothetical protein